MKSLKHLLILLFLLAYVPVKSQHPAVKKLNNIVLPGDSAIWKQFAEKIRNVKHTGNLKILHFGDSHIQGDYFTGQVRRNLMQYSGVTPISRGFTLAYKIAGTNGPDELFSRSDGCLQPATVRKVSGYFPLSGYRITSCDTGFSVSLKDTSQYRFNLVYLLHSALKNQKISVNGLIPASVRTLSDSLQISEFQMPGLQSEILIRVQNTTRGESTSIFALSLQNTGNNVLYHSMGVNGATFGTFLSLGDTRLITGYINPDCVIVSYGTNDALNKSIDTTTLKQQIVQAIRLIRSALPDVPVIFTTPGDFLVNKQHNTPRTALISKVIRNTALENNCAYWDFFSVMGGPGSVREWYRHQLVFPDWIHLSKKGYRFQGDLFFEALIKLKDI